LQVLETGSTLSLFAANEFSATVASDVTKEGRNNFDKTPVFSRALFKQVSFLERAVLYSPSWQRFGVNRDQLVIV